MSILKFIRKLTGIPVDNKNDFNLYLYIIKNYKIIPNDIENTNNGYIVWFRRKFKQWGVIPVCENKFMAIGNNWNFYNIFKREDYFNKLRKNLGNPPEKDDFDTVLNYCSNAIKI